MYFIYNVWNICIDLQNHGKGGGQDHTVGADPVQGHATLKDHPEEHIQDQGPDPSHQIKMADIGFT